MKPLRYRDDDSTSGIILGAIVGALAGFAAGMDMAQHAGTTDADALKGERADAEPVHERIRSAHGESDADFDDELEDDFEDIDDEEFEEEYDVTLEERVLEAFRNDPILSARAVDIGSLRTGVIELAGVVETAQEAQHAVTIARGVPGVETVVNRIVTGVHEPRYQEAAQSRRRHAATHEVERPVGDSRVVRGDMAAKPSQPDEAVRGDQPPFEGGQTL
jgi:hypothetical protein